MCNCRRYGVALVGHRNERVVNAIKSQIDKVITVHSSFYNKTREEFLQTLIDIAPSGLSQVHLNNSGAESIEAAIKFARMYGSNIYTCVVPIDQK